MKCSSGPALTLSSGSLIKSLIEEKSGNTKQATKIKHTTHCSSRKVLIFVITDNFSLNGEEKRGMINPLPPSDDVRKKIRGFFSSEMSQFKKYRPSENLKFNNLRIFQSLELRILVEKIVPISLTLNFTPNTLGCCGLTDLRSYSKS